ncbi:response regulator [Marinobacter mobilis]|uniref:Two-component system, chemotaxis family, response regulator CheY n=1 Tax=Marinobacter mobilis TaxID=488533 RepID=A0A1H2W355_9GAMM|nr:response regulator [Marinobacter mobilis]SDW74971.1 two-component system, chemotaxis family, response regulator CheY [Marinobacter mobilis]SDX52249.1 two-component system, chemotaxis family, response regulator CheY [Marinobacter mobilis]
MHNLKVMVVEDEPVMREMLRDMLYHAGATRVVESEDARGARAVFAADSYQIVMLDLGLPDGDGHELMKEFKDANPGQHVVLVTADDSIESIQKAISAGANGYVVKPYSQEKIHDVVNNYAMIHGSEASGVGASGGLGRKH